MYKLAFTFISGKYEGGEFPIPDSGELLIGRGAELDMVLMEEMISRKHARVFFQNGQLTIQDLGSTNGTFVNGEKIQQTPLNIGDRVLIGTSILKVTELSNTASVASSNNRRLKPSMQDLENPDHKANQTLMSGELEEVPLPDLLQLFATNRKSGILTIGGPSSSKLYLKDGKLLHAVMENAATMQPMKVICRLLALKSGYFQFEALDAAPQVPEGFTTSTENVLIEASRQNDEAQRLLKQLPSMNSQVRLVMPLSNRLADLNSQELDILQLAINMGRLELVMDKTEATDQEALSSLQKLLRLGFLAVVNH